VLADAAPAVGGPAPGEPGRSRYDSVREPMLGRQSNRSRGVGLARPESTGKLAARQGANTLDERGLLGQGAAEVGSDLVRGGSPVRRFRRSVGY